MTQKELLYIEDAIGHEKTIISVIDDSIKNLDDEDLITYMKDELDTHTAMKDDLTKLLEDKKNE